MPVLSRAPLYKPGMTPPRLRGGIVTGTCGMWLFQSGETYPVPIGLEHAAATAVADNSTKPTVLTQRGLARAHTIAGTDGIQLIRDESLMKVTSSVTVILGYEKHDSTNRQSTAFGIAEAGNTARRLAVYLPWTDGVVYWDFGGFSSGTTRLTASGLTTTGYNAWAFTVGTRGMEIWQARNGYSALRVANNGATPTRTSQVGAAFGLGSGFQGGGVDSDLANYHWLYVSRDQLPGGLIAEIMVNPYGTLLESTEVRPKFFDIGVVTEEEEFNETVTLSEDLDTAASLTTTVSDTATLSEELDTSSGRSLADTASLTEDVDLSPGKVIGETETVSESLTFSSGDVTSEETTPTETLGRRVIRGFAETVITTETLTRSGTGASLSATPSDTVSGAESLTFGTQGSTTPGEGIISASGRLPRHRFLYDLRLTPQNCIPSHVSPSPTQRPSKYNLQQPPGSALGFAHGTYTGKVDAFWIVEITDITDGTAIGQAKFKYSKDAGATFTTTEYVTSTNDVALEDGISFAWENAGVGIPLVIGDRWAFRTPVYYGVASMIDYQDRNKEYRSGIVPEIATFDIDFGTPVLCRALVLFDHGLSGGATVKVKANTTASWTSPPVDEDVPVTAQRATHFFTGGSYRFWRIEVRDQGRSIVIGKLYLGDYMDLRYRKTSHLPWTKFKQRFGPVSAGERRYRKEAIEAVQTVFPLMWDLLPDEDAERLETMRQTVWTKTPRRLNRPLFFLPDAYKTTEVYLCWLEEHQPKKRYPNRWRVDLRLRTVVRL